MDLASRAVVNEVLLPDGPPGAQPLIPRTFSHGIGIAPDGKSLWVTSLLDDSVSVFSLRDRKRLSTTHVGKAPDWMTFSADGSRCYVTNAGSDAVSVLDVASRKELTRVPVGAMPKRIISIIRPFGDAVALTRQPAERGPDHEPCALRLSRIPLRRYDSSS